MQRHIIVSIARRRQPLPNVKLKIKKMPARDRRFDFSGTLAEREPRADGARQRRARSAAPMSLVALAVGYLQRGSSQGDGRFFGGGLGARGGGLSARRPRTPAAAAAALPPPPPPRPRAPPPSRRHHRRAPAVSKRMRCAPRHPPLVPLRARHASGRSRRGVRRNARCAVFAMGLAGMASTGENFGWGRLGGASWCGAGRARSAARAMARDGFFCQGVFAYLWR